MSTSSEKDGNVTVKKLIKVILGFLVGVGVIVGSYKIMEVVQKNEMSQIVKSEEVEQIYLKVLTCIDPDALTEKGKIQKYTIYSFKKIPTGGIFVYLYVNDNKDYTISFNLYKDYNTGKIEYGGGSWSPELVEFVKSKKAE